MYREKRSRESIHSSFFWSGPYACNITLLLLLLLSNAYLKFKRLIYWDKEELNMFCQLITHQKLFTESKKNPGVLFGHFKYTSCPDVQVVTIKMFYSAFVLCAFST